MTNFLIKTILPKLRGNYFEPSYIYFKHFPIHKINSENTNEVKKHTKIVSLVEQMLNLHKNLSATRDPRSREQLQRRIDATDKQIDRLVYELYDLTEDEIRVVEGLKVI